MCGVAVCALPCGGVGGRTGRGVARWPGGPTGCRQPHPVPFEVVAAPAPAAQGIVSNDGAKIMSLLDIVHPAAKTLVDIAQAQDAEIGDGTTTVVLLAGELLKVSKSFVEDGIHPQVIVRVRRPLAAPSRARDCGHRLCPPHRASGRRFSLPLQG